MPRTSRRGKHRRDTNDLGQPNDTREARERHDEEGVAEGPVADSFGIGDSVAATKDFCIGGALAVSDGCRGTVVCHGERPDGTVGVSVKFEVRTDGRDTNVLCSPREIRVVAKVEQTPPVDEQVSTLERQLEGALESTQAWAASWSSKISRRFAQLFNRFGLGASDTSKRKRRSADRARNVDDDDEALDDFADMVAETSRGPTWRMIIVILVLVNLILGCLHMRRHLKKQKVSVVTSLTDETFPDHIAKNHGGTLVNFHFKGCKPCAKLKSEFDAAARQLWNTRRIPFVAVDADDAPSILKQYDVKMFPSLLWFRRGKIMRNPEPAVRDAAKIIEFVEESLQPPVIDFASHDELNEALPQLRSIMSRGISPPVVVGFGRDPRVHDILDEIGEKFRGSSAFLFVKEVHDGDPFIRAYFRDAKADKDYNAGLAIEDVLAWLQPFMNSGPVAL